MGYNYKGATIALKKKLSAWSIICLESGMSEDKTESFISEMKEFEKSFINMERKYKRHTVSYSQYSFSNDEENATEEHSPLLKDYLEQFSATPVEIMEWNRYAWIDDLDNPILIEFVATLSDKDIELLTFMISDEKRQTEIAQLQSRSDAAVSKQKKHIREKFIKWYADKAGYSVDLPEIKSLEEPSNLHILLETTKGKN